MKRWVKDTPLGTQRQGSSCGLPRAAVQAVPTAGGTRTMMMASIALLELQLLLRLLRLAV